MTSEPYVARPKNGLGELADRVEAASVERMIATYRFRLRDKYSADLNQQARTVNFVWNYCNETQQKAAKDGRKWLSAFDLIKLTSGSSKLIGLHSETIEGVCKQYARSRQQHKRPWLRFRGRKYLGWVPFKDGNVKIVGRAFKFHGRIYEPMHWRDMPDGVKICAGSFSQDAKGHWYINLPIDAEHAESAPEAAVGIDLGLKDLATLSDGRSIPNPHHFRQAELALGKALRAGKKKLARNINMRIQSARKDHLHKITAELARSHNLIVVGDVSPSKLSQTRFAKSVQDAGWATFKTMLRYKAMRHNGVMLEVNERFTSQVCSVCGSMPPQRPRGIADLGIREWTCGDCGAAHSRDVNAARNILRVGLDTLAEGARV